MSNDGMGAWPLASYDMVQAGKDLGLSPRREATPWFKNQTHAKDAPQERKGYVAPPAAPKAPWESVQAWLERTAREPLTITLEDLPDTGRELKTICGIPAEQWVREGWVKWTATDSSNKSPIPQETEFQVLLEDGVMLNGYGPSYFRWSRRSYTDNIIAYCILD